MGRVWDVVFAALRDGTHTRSRGPAGLNFQKDSRKPRNVPEPGIVMGNELRTLRWGESVLEGQDSGEGESGLQVGTRLADRRGGACPGLDVRGFQPSRRTQS